MYAVCVWLNAPDWVTYGLLGLIAFGSVVSWISEEVKRATKRSAPEEAPAPSE